MAKQPPSVKTNRPPAVEETTHYHSVIQTAEILTRAMKHQEEAASLADHIGELRHSLTALFNRFRDWQGLCEEKVEGLGPELGGTLRKLYQDTANILRSDIRQLTQTIETIDLSGTPADELPRF